MKLTVCVEKGVKENKGAMPILLLILLQQLLLRNLTFCFATFTSTTTTTTATTASIATTCKAKSIPSWEKTPTLA